MNMKKILFIFLMVAAIMLTAITVFAEDKIRFSVNAYLTHTLEPDEYGGIYSDGKNMHIKPLKQSREKVEQAAKKANQLLEAKSIDSAVIVDEDVAYSIEELATTKKVLRKVSKQFKCDMGYNIEKNAVSLYRTEWTAELEKQIHDLAGTDHIIFEKFSSRDDISFLPTVVIRLDKNLIEWYQGDYYSRESNFISAASFTSPVYQKDGEWMIPLNDFVAASPYDSYINWNEYSVLVVLGNENYTIQFNSPNVRLNGFEVKQEEFRGMVLKEGTLYVPAKTIFAMLNNYDGKVQYSENNQIISYALYKD